MVIHARHILPLQDRTGECVVYLRVVLYISSVTVYSIVSTVGNNIISVDGVAKEVDASPYISEDNRTMVPVRFVSEFLGASVEWIEPSREVIIRSEEHVIKLTIDSTTYYVDNRKKFMDTCPVIVNDRTFLPIRYISEALSCKISYREENGTQVVDIISL